MIRSVLVSGLFLCIASVGAFAQSAAPDWRMAYAPSHRVIYVKQWTYTFPEFRATTWVIALRYPPELAWSRDAVGKAELLTSGGWKPFKEVIEGSKEKRRMLLIDYEQDDPALRSGFTIRTTFTATIYHQQLVRGRPSKAIGPLTDEEKESYLAETDTFDFSKPNVKEWMDNHRMWIAKGERPINFVHRVYKELRSRNTLPYDTKDGGPWICSQILKVGYGECCRHAIVGTSILRANHIPARTVCGLWAIDDKSSGGHCWGEFFSDGIGWIPYDTTVDSSNHDTEAYFAIKKGEVLAGMVDFDWSIAAGPFGQHTVFAVDAFPAYWGKGEGSMDNPKVDAMESVRVLPRLR